MALSVRREGFYVWTKRKNRPSSDDKTVSALKAARKAHPDYGVRSLRDELPAGIRPGYGKCCRLCRENGLLHRKKTPRGMTKRNNKDPLSEDLIQRDFKAVSPNAKWLSDITEMKCRNGKLYLAAILDCFDGTIVGLSMNSNKKAGLCVSALENAVGRFGKRDGLILHSDHGSQYTSRAYRSALTRYGLRQSMGRTGSCFDNARMESFFATLKKDLIYQMPLYKMTRKEVRYKVFAWIELYYNAERRYTANEGNLPPLKKRALFFSLAA